MSSANNQLSQAESLFHLCRDLQPDALAGKLATTLHSSSHHEIRAMSAILLRKILTRDSSLSPDGDSSSPSYLWPRLLLASQASLKSLLPASIQGEEVKSIAKKLFDTVFELAAGLLPDDAWSELVIAIAAMVAATMEVLRLNLGSLGEMSPVSGKKLQ